MKKMFKRQSKKEDEEWQKKRGERKLKLKGQNKMLVLFMTTDYTS